MRRSRRTRARRGGGSRSRSSRRICGETCTRSGIGCPRGPISRPRCARWRSRRRAARESWVPTVADRIAQTRRDGAGGENRQSSTRTLTATAPGAARWTRWHMPGRCWKTDWVIDLESEVLRQRAVGPGGQGGRGEPPTVGGAVCAAVAGAPLRLPDGTLRQRDRGTPQGSSVSPVLANLFLHYAFDAWMDGSSRASVRAVRG